MPDSDDTLIQAFRKELRDSARKRKSDDIVDFIKSNWSLFSDSRKKVFSLCDELDRSGELTPTVLCDALGMPKCIFFRKTLVSDAARLLVDPCKSPVLKAFRQQAEGAGGIVMFVVAGTGERRLVMTDIGVARVSDRPRLVVEGDDADISIFPLADTRLRLPEMFNREN